jgi:hypothetical protein
MMKDLTVESAENFHNDNDNDLKFFRDLNIFLFSLNIFLIIIFCIYISGSSMVHIPEKIFRFSRTDRL